MGGLTTKRKVAMFLVAVLINQMAVATETVNSLQSNDVCDATELTVHSCSKEEESLNELRAEKAPAVTELFLEGTAQGECENASQTLWNMYKENASKVFEIDFVQYLRNGTLCNDSSDKYYRYKFYTAQDAFYAKAAAVASYFMEFHETNKTIKHLLQESRVSDEKYLQPLLSRIEDWRAEGWTEPSPVQAAIDYVSFDLGVAMNTSDVANVANAMASKAICVRLYMYIANTIAGEWNCTIYSHPYKEWIDDNVSPGLNDSYVSPTEEMLDLVASNLSATQCQQLQYYYGEGLRHEFEFFKAVDKCPPPPPPNNYGNINSPLSTKYGLGVEWDCGGALGHAISLSGLGAPCSSYLK